MDVRDPLIGVRLGDYQVVERIGEGGMGVVYRGFQPRIKKPVAIKVLKPEIAARPEQVRRLLEEARSVKAIGHRGIVDIFGSGQLPDGRHYLVMEYLEGQTLEQKLRDRGPFFPHEAIALLKEICGTLAAAHARGIVHRDLKPGNVFVVTRPDGARSVKLLDFGLAKHRPPEGEAESVPTPSARPVTSATTIVGTAEYMAPEQIRAEPVSPQADLYALGVMAFEVLTGQLPFHGPSIMELLRKHLESPPLPPSSRVDGLPAALDALVLQLLAKDPAQRPASADVVREELTSIQRTLDQVDTQRVTAAGMDEITGVIAIPPGARRGRRRRWIRVAASVGMAVVAGLVGALAVRSCLSGGK